MPPRAIVLALDQLSRRCLGCYGHEWIETPHLDRLASRGVVFDQCFASPIPERSLADVIQTLTDRLPDDSVIVRRLREPDEAGDRSHLELNQTPFAQLVTLADQQLAEWTQDAARSWLLWLESRGIGWPGLATAEFVELYADELADDLPPQVLAMREIDVAYAALLTQFDHLLGQLLTSIDRRCGADAPLFVLVAAQGQPVGEVEKLSPFAEGAQDLPGVLAATGLLRDEHTHVPLLIAGTAVDAMGSRRQELVMPGDLLPTIGEWFGTLSDWTSDDDSRSLWPLLRNDDTPWRTELFLRDAEGRAAVRTTQRLFVDPSISRSLAQNPAESPIEPDESPACLFVKPEDAWEVNNVAAQHPNDVMTLGAVLRRWLTAHDAGEHRNSQ